jgi:hypothetical protein
MIDLTKYKILRYTYPFKSEELEERIWDKMSEDERRWAIKLTLDGINDSDDLEDGSYDTFFFEDKLKQRVDNILNKYKVPFEITDQTQLLLEGKELLSDELLGKLNKFLNEELSVDDVLDHILEVGVENISVFERYYLDNNIEFRIKK